MTYILTFKNIIFEETKLHNLSQIDTKSEEKPNDIRGGWGVLGGDEGKIVFPKPLLET